VRHIYFVKTIEVYMIGGKEVYWLVHAKNEDEALKIVGVEDKTDERFGFIKELPPEVEFTRVPKWDKVKLHEVEY